MKMMSSLPLPRRWAVVFKHVSIGRFMPGDSPVHRLDPRVKLLLGLGFAAVVFFVRSWPAFVLLALYVVLAIFASRLPWGFILAGLRPVFTLIVFTAILHLLFTTGEPLWTFGPLTITVEGVQGASLLGARLLLLLVGLQTVTLTTAPLALTGALEWLLKPGQRFGVPAHEIALMMTIALSFVPTLIDELDRIMKAQTARGADFAGGSVFRRVRALVPVLIPLFVSAFRRADDLSVAMESRGYRGAYGRTEWRRQTFAPNDYAVLFASLAFIVWIGWQG